ncbi:TonB-dependent receptor [Pseudopedobacter beijingensis]|uniref:TonB-dependent receptor n=1 Tax=Pseudopedobacter beijingensis TaxID=1207056 RepID=A0ABW4IGD3_9SPHI
MKLTSLLLLCFCLHISAASLSQTVTLKVKSQPLTKILETIEKQTGYLIIYNDRYVRPNTLVSVNADNKSLEDVLESVLTPLSLTYFMKEKTIAISYKRGIKTEVNTLNSIKQLPKTITGIVSDDTGEVLPGVLIAVKNTKTYAQTNVDGGYSIKVPEEGSILVFSIMGFDNSEVTVGNKNVINVSMRKTFKKLEEVVVVGYGTQSKRELTGAVSSIKEEQMDQFAGGSLVTSMQGKIAGLQITTNSGEPGAGANITLRGVSSINGASQPLYIIDGVIMENTAFTSLSEDGASFSPLNDINPSDIASIEVLKDAGTASIYGAMASNGVILITTKSGSTFKKPTINFSYNSSFVEISRKIGVLNAAQFREANYEANLNARGTPKDRIPLYDSLHPYYRNSYNWQDIMYRTTYQQKFDFSIGGSSKEKNVDYFVSVGYRNLPPVMIETKYRQVFGTAKVNYKLNKSIRGTTSFNLSNFQYNRQDNGVVFRYLTTMPVYSPYDPITGQLIPLFEGSKANPIARVQYETNDIKRWNFIGRQEVGVNIIKGLDFKTVFALNVSDTEAFYYWPPILSPSSSATPTYSDYRPEMTTLFDQSNTLTYTKKIKGGHNLTALLGQSYRLVKTNSTYVRGLDNIDNQITSINGSARIRTFSQNMQENALLSYFTRLNYNYKGKYLASFVMRRDGSSRFGEDNRNAYFPSVSGGWRFSQEKFMKAYKWLYDGKIRASYGVTGNQFIGNYASQGAIGRAGSYLEEVALTVNTMPNKDLKWETTRQLDIGADLSFLKGRLNFTADYYVKNSYDLLFNVLIPSQTGYNSMPFNLGDLSNKGFEFDINGVVLNKGVKWTSTFTFGTNKNTVTSLPGGEDYRPNAYSLARVGEAVGVFYGYKALGVYARDEDNVYIDHNGVSSQYRKGSVNGDIYKGGDVIFEDVNNDGVIDINDWQIIGNPTPKAFGGLQNKFEYKRFTLNVFVNYVFGNKIFNQLWRNQDSNQWEPNYSDKQLRRWKKQGDVTDIPRLVLGDPMQNYAVSSLFIEDGSFIRLQNIALSYNLPTSITKKLNMASANIGINAQNLLTFGSYTGYDPEVSAGVNPFGFGVDNGAFPKSRSYNLSLNIKF